MDTTSKTFQKVPLYIKIQMLVNEKQLLAYQDLVVGKGHSKG